MQTVFITGVSSGLGYGLAKVYLERGVCVYGCSRREPSDLVEQGLRFASVDLGIGEAGMQPVSELLSEEGSLDLVVLNAAKLGQIRDMSETPLHDLRETMEINVFANKWLLDLAFLEGRQVGQVVAISSGASQSGSRGWNGYSLSKATLNMLVKLYAGEQTDTHFCSLAPGLVDTAIQDYLTGLPEDERYQPLQILKDAKGTDRMPDGDTCARGLVEIFPELRALPSGEYADIRKLSRT